MTMEVAKFALEVGHVMDMLCGSTLPYDDVVVWANTLRYILDELQENGDEDIDEFRDVFKRILNDVLLELDLEPQEEDPVNCTD